MSTENYNEGPLKLKRNEHGLFENIKYEFTSDGFINWRSMINPEFLYPNKDWFKRNGKPVPDSIEGLEDNQLLCRLGGYKELARLRGYQKVTYEFTPTHDGVSAVCIINWIPNYETLRAAVGYDGVSPQEVYVDFSSTANSTSQNCGDFMAAFKETQAENRAFVRAVRNFLNINIVGDDEISKGMVIEQPKQPKQENSVDLLDPYITLQRHAENKGFKSYEQFRANFLNPLIANGKYAPKEAPKTKWQDWRDIPVVEVTRIIPLLNK